MALPRTIVIVALLGCTVPRASVPTVPAAALTASERVNAFMQLRAVAEENLWASRCTHRVGCSDELESKALYLADGTRVEEPEQLITLVAEGSETARAAHNAQHARARARMWFAVAVGALVGSVAIAAKTADFTLGIAIGLPGVLVPAALTWHHSAVAIEQSVVAHDRYNEGLAARLHVCIRGLYVAPCEAPVGTVGSPMSQRATAIAANRAGR